MPKKNYKLSVFTSLCISKGTSSIHNMLRIFEKFQNSPLPEDDTYESLYLVEEKFSIRVNPQSNANQGSTFRGDFIREARVWPDVLGPDVAKMFFDAIERRGVVLDSNHYYSSEEVEGMLLYFLGNDLAKILVERLKKETQPR
ncbi:hypothetical protein [Nitrososphaera sp.]|uniref:hypothetical protein n=1 Tax=Nitrososphaera sp. TaxID=1971748 RepID=UPI002ED9FD98